MPRSPRLACGAFAFQGINLDCEEEKNASAMLLQLTRPELRFPLIVHDGLSPNIAWSFRESPRRASFTRPQTGCLMLHERLSPWCGAPLGRCSFSHGSSIDSDAIPTPYHAAMNMKLSTKLPTAKELR